jgi:hypothetical protein
MELDVTPAVAAALADDRLVSFGLTTALDTWTSFSAKEGSHPPQLVIGP